MSLPFSIKVKADEYIKRVENSFPDSNTRYLLDHSILVNTRGFGADQYGREMIDDMNLSTEEGYDSRGISNFDHNDFLLYNHLTGYYEWGAISSYKTQIMSRADMDYLWKIQPNDYDPNAKKNWLYGHGRPYFSQGGNDVYGTMVSGHSKIRVLSDSSGNPIFKELYVEMPRNKTVEKRKFCEVVGFRHYMMDTNKFSPAWLLENGFLQIMAQANPKPVHNTIVYNDRGKKYHPIYDFSDWPGNSPSSCKYYIWANSIYLTGSKYTLDKFPIM
jgi:hypothetical protein